MYKITIPGNPVTKKNSQRILMNRKTKKRFIAPSEAYKRYEEQCGWIIARMGGILPEKPFNIKCTYYMKTKGKVDLTNLLSATMDILTKYKIIKDDDYKHVPSNNGSSVHYDKLDPRCEIEITYSNVSDIPNLRAAELKLQSNIELYEKLTKENKELFIKMEELKK